MSKLFTAVVIDVPRRLRFSNRAVYRVGTLDKPLALSDLSNRKRSQAALFQWVWACLDGDDAKAFETPEDLADAVKSEQLPELYKALSEAIQLSQPSEKNADSSTPSHSPASSSA